MVAGALAGQRSSREAVVSLPWRLLLILQLASLGLAAAWRDFPPHAPALFPIHFYQRVIGHLDGKSCPSHPVCSLYAREAISRHGLLLGSWLALDRLIHEADDLQRGPWIDSDGERRLYDPLARNDRWLGKGEVR